MVVGILEITLGLESADSLKAKRKVVKSLVDRARHRFNCAVSEVGDNDVHRRARIGVSTVANDAQFVNSVLDKVLDAFEEAAIGRAEVLDTRLEILHV